MGDTCRALHIPVIGGNVSFYNESRGRDIDPTPIVGTLGLIDQLDRRPPGVGLIDGGRLVLLGSTEANLGGSQWALVAHSHRGGQLPALDVEAHRRLLAFVAELVTEGLPAGVHDVSDGGLAVALAEMAVRSGVGFEVDVIGTHAELFSESPSRVVLCAEPDVAQEILSRAAEAGVPASFLGASGGDRMVVAGLFDLSVADATESWRTVLPAALQPT
jgi:phosphoribosylformylglycinamidine synthase